jgi:hypothetical protein
MSVKSASRHRELTAASATRFRSRFSSAKSDAYKVHALVRILFAQPVITYLILHMLLSLQEAYFLAYFRGLPVSCSKRFVAETVARAISAAAVMKISPAPFRG